MRPNEPVTCGDAVWTRAGVGVQLRVIANESGPNPSPPTDGRRQSQTSAASARRCPPCKEPVRADLRPVVTSHVLLELAVSSRRRPWQQPRPSWFRPGGSGMLLPWRRTDTGADSHQPGQDLNLRPLDVEQAGGRCLFSLARIGSDLPQVWPWAVRGCACRCPRWPVS